MVAMKTPVDILESGARGGEGVAGNVVDNPRDSDHVADNHIHLGVLAQTEFQSRNPGPPAKRNFNNLHSDVNTDNLQSDINPDNPQSDINSETVIHNLTSWKIKSESANPNPINTEKSAGPINTNLKPRTNAKPNMNQCGTQPQPMPAVQQREHYQSDPNPESNKAHKPNKSNPIDTTLLGRALQTVSTSAQWSTLEGIYTKVKKQTDKEMRKQLNSNAQQKTGAKNRDLAQEKTGQKSVDQKNADQKNAGQENEDQKTAGQKTAGQKNADTNRVSSDRIPRSARELVTWLQSVEKDDLEARGKRRNVERRRYATVVCRNSNVEMCSMVNLGV
jgi:hypothetical protein